MDKASKMVKKKAEKPPDLDELQAWLSAFGDAISGRREELVLTQQELADASGVNRTYVSDIERGRRNVTVTTMKRIAAALSLTSSDLLRLADERSKSSTTARKIKRA